MEGSARPITPDTTPRLARKLGLADAVFVGLGAMIGAGIFSAIAPAAAASGSWMLVSLAIAAGVALCNALSSAQLAALYPAAGGTYVYGRERLGAFWGYLAGWGFVIGKVASCAAMALTFGFYVHEDFARPLAVGAVATFTIVNVLGVQKTARVASVLVVAVVATLSLPVLSAFALPSFDAGRAFPDSAPPGGLGLLEGGALLFFAFAGYARIATLGEEVVEPAKTIPRAIPVALAITVAIYALVIGAALIALGPDGLAGAKAPLAATVEASDLDAWAPVIRIGAALASLSVLLSLLAGVSRTSFAMARERDLPGWLDAVHPRYGVPHRAEIVAGVIVAVLAATIDLRSAIGFSSFAVLGYYAIANASAWTLAGDERRFPKFIAGMGVAGCVALAISLPWETLAAGGALFAVGIAVYGGRRFLTAKGRDRD
ncbi:MAG TPA: amino acid permease [Dehalococcoidia bacterium]|nr:amino acid permease [Dehalococcoidia bacterium]